MQSVLRDERPTESENIMTLSEARNHIEQQLELASGYSRNAIQVILMEVCRSHGVDATRALIIEFGLLERFQIHLETVCSAGG